MSGLRELGARNSANEGDELGEEMMGGDMEHWTTITGEIVSSFE